MIDHVWSVLCSHAVVDRRTNNASLQHVVEQITIRQEPRPDAAVMLPLDLMTLWVRSDFDVPHAGRERVLYCSPSGDVLLEHQLEIRLDKAKRSRTVLTFESLQVAQPGRYSFHVELQGEIEDEWTRVATIPLEVIYQPPEEETPE